MSNWKLLSSVNAMEKVWDRKLWVKANIELLQRFILVRDVYVHCVWVNICNAPFKWKANRFFIVIIISSSTGGRVYDIFFAYLIPPFCTQSLFILSFRYLNRFIEFWHSLYKNDTFNSIRFDLFVLLFLYSVAFLLPSFLMYTT